MFLHKRHVQQKPCAEKITGATTDYKPIHHRPQASPEAAQQLLQKLIHILAFRRGDGISENGHKRNALKAKHSL